jgi:hypothetical protein
MFEPLRKRPALGSSLGIRGNAPFMSISFLGAK